MDWTASRADSRLPPTQRLHPPRKRSQQHRETAFSDRSPVRPRQRRSSPTAPSAYDDDFDHFTDHRSSPQRTMRDPRPTMDVKVLYTLDSSPSHTMVARMGRAIPVDVIRPAGGPPSSPTPGGSGPSRGSASRVRFGRVTLKACLSAICIASPELIFDRKRDYIIYAVDPEETFRAAQQRSPTGAPRPYVGRAAGESGSQHAESSKQGAAAAEASTPSAMLVGKGYFSWGLEEGGDGETIVSGKVRCEGVRSVYRDGQLVDEDIDVLEVVLKMKETQARSKDQYFNLVRGFGASSSVAEPASPDYARTSRQQSHVSHHGIDSRRERSMQLRSEPDYHHHSQPSRPERPSPATAASFPLQRGSTRRSLAPAGDVFGFESFSAQGRTTLSAKKARAQPKELDQQQPMPTQAAPAAPTPALAAPTPAAPTPKAAATVPSAATPTNSLPAPNPQALQLLTLLQTLQNHQAQPGQPAPAPQQQAQLSSLLGLVAGALGAGLMGDSEGFAAGTPQQQQQQLPTPEPLPAPVLEAGAAPAGNTPSAAPRSEHAADGKENCAAAKPSTATTKSNKSKNKSKGKADATTDKAPAAVGNAPLAEATSPVWSAIGGSNETGDDDAEPQLKNICYNCGNTYNKAWRIMELPAGTAVEYPASERPPLDASPDYVCRATNELGPVPANGKSRWTACNPCSLYFMKWNGPRPRHMWAKDCQAKAARKDELAPQHAFREGEKRPSDQTLDDSDRKRIRVSRTDDEACSPAYSIGAATPASTAGGKDAPGSTGKSLPRTLSEACHRESEKLGAERLEREEGRSKNHMLVLDEYGQWRSRRSVRENPTGRKVGRPKGTTRKNVEGSKPGTPADEPAKDEGADAKAAKDTTPGSTAAPAADKSKGKKAKETSSANTARSSPALPRSRKGEAEATAKKNDGVFRAPAPPSTSGPAAASLNATAADASAGGRTVSFAQSSPVRPSLASRNAIADSLPLGHATPFDSPSRDLRFGVPNYLLNSSPGTMMDTLMSEADFDFEELGPANLFSTPGSLIGLASGLHGTPTPLRRSPRKNPGGTKSGQNPFATHIEPTSPSLGQSSRALQNAQRLVLSSDASPVTRSRTRSGQGVLHPALFSSSDSPTEGKQSKQVKSSSNVTSPISPSPKRTAKGGPGGKAKNTAAGNTDKARVEMAARKQAVQSRANGKATLLTDGLDEDDDDDEEEQLTKGPYPSARGSSACPRSPGHARTLRRGAPSRPLQSTSAASGVTGASRLSHLDLPPSSPPAFDHPTTESANFADVEVDGWGRTPSMREIFPTPSDADWASEGQQSPDKAGASTTQAGPTASNNDQAQQQDSAAASGSLSVASSRRPSASPHTALMPLPRAHVARRPLPATVEDASTTSGSSPEDNDSPDQDAELGSNVFELFDDPYGLLAASGFGVHSTGMSADAFNDVELHRSMEFGNHLQAFTQQGGVGIAAHVAPTGTGDATSAAIVGKTPSVGAEQAQRALTSSSSAPPAAPTVAVASIKPQQADGSGTTTTSVAQPPQTPSTAEITSFLSSFPAADLAALFASPGKPKVGAQLLETLLSPRGGGGLGKARGGQAALGVPAPLSLPGIGVGGGGEVSSSGEGQGQGQEDLLALLNNPDIQAMLAEFGDLPNGGQQHQQQQQPRAIEAADEGQQPS